ncbi:MAG: histidine phosphatase family protein [Thermovirgaceae bacterium]
MSEKRHVLFVRHGQTDWNLQYRYQGKADIPLNERGRKEATLLGERLKSWTPCSVYSSPLARAAETARILAASIYPRPPVDFVDDLAEIDFGDWESHSVYDVARKDPKLYAAWRADPSLVTSPGGEAFENVLARVKRALEHIFEESSGDLLIVFHGGTIRAALSILFGLPPSMVWKMRLGNCSMTGLEMRDGTCFLAFFNDGSHLRVPENLAGIIPLGEW